MKRNKHNLANIIFTLLLSSMLIDKTCFAVTEFSIPVSSGDEINVERFPASGKYLILWLAPEYGLRTTHRALARSLSEENIEVWQSDISQSLFMPQNSTSIKKLSGKRIADIIEYAHKVTGKKIILASDSYGAITALLGAHQWQQRKQKTSYLIGAILFSPNTYAIIPPLGQKPEYMPIISASNIPIMIYQAKKNSNIGQFEALIENLQQHGNPVYSRILPEVTALFYDEMPNKKNLQQLKLLPENIKKMISVLEKHKVPAKPIKLIKRKINNNGIDIYLKEYKGNISPLPISLEDAYGNVQTIKDYKGKITIINFWATWCPPCVEEIPALNSLKKKMQGFPFQLISINYAEDKKTITDFMKKVKVDFPVLLDQNGSFAKRWDIITYPSTFVINKEGKIKYGVNAAIEWDSPELINKIKSLL